MNPSFLDRLLGPPLATYEEDEHRVDVASGIPMLGLDALSSAAYGPEAALTILLPLGVAGLTYIGPIIGVILVLLTLLYLSYRQTIAAYPTGGGSYTVAKENLGLNFGLLAAASLLLDYILNVAVGISAGVENLVSAVPELQHAVLPLCLVVLALITVVNLRGVRESGRSFAIPTYLFAGSLLAVIALGLWRSVSTGGSPAPVVPPPTLPPAVGVVSLWLVAKAFASGCTAMTGVEAVSNGVGAFDEPRVKNAQRTLTVIVVLLALLLAGIAYLAIAFHIGAPNPDLGGPSVISQLVAAVLGRNWFYYLCMASVMVVLALSANTSFAGFPRLCHLLAHDGFLPRIFGNRGRRLVYSGGILVLAVLSALLLIAFGGITDRLIPLFAVGAFGAFTLSQAGMVVHWRRQGERRRVAALGINAVGAVATGIALAVVLVAKFVAGAWITILLIPTLLAVFVRTRRHYDQVEQQTTCPHPLDTSHLEPPIVIVPVNSWTRQTERALRFAMSISQDVMGLFIATGEDGDDAGDVETSEALAHTWAQEVEAPCQLSGVPSPRLRIVASPYRQLFRPLIDLVDELKRDNPLRTVAVVIPEMVELHWYDYLLHNQRAAVLKTALLFSGRRHVAVINIPWYLKEAGT